HIIPRRPISPLFPYTTLFRSLAAIVVIRVAPMIVIHSIRFIRIPRMGRSQRTHPHCNPTPRRRVKRKRDGSVKKQMQALAAVARSEEHTSELQSLAYLVCRLL